MGSKDQFPKLLLHILGIGATIRNGQEIQFLPYAGFYDDKVANLVSIGSAINRAYPI